MRKTKVVMIAHTLGNPFDLKAIRSFRCTWVWLIEDNCDALGSEYCMDGAWKKTGSIGDIGTSSFYPPHHMTMGEGGAVYTDNPFALQDYPFPARLGEGLYVSVRKGQSVWSSF